MDQGLSTVTSELLKDKIEVCSRCNKAIGSGSLILEQSIRQICFLMVVMDDVKNMEERPLDRLVEVMDKVVRDVDGTCEEDCVISLCVVNCAAEHDRRDTDSFQIIVM